MYSADEMPGGSPACTSRRAYPQQHCRSTRPHAWTRAFGCFGLPRRLKPSCSMRAGPPSHRRNNELYIMSTSRHCTYSMRIHAGRRARPRITIHVANPPATALAAPAGHMRIRSDVAFFLNDREHGPSIN